MKAWVSHMKENILSPAHRMEDNFQLVFEFI